MRFQHSIYQLSNDREQRERDSRYLREKQESSPTGERNVVGFGEPKSGWKGQINSLLRVGNASKVFGWKIGF